MRESGVRGLKGKGERERKREQGIERVQLSGGGGGDVFLGGGRRDGVRGGGGGGGCEREAETGKA